MIDNDSVTSFKTLLLEIQIIIIKQKFSQVDRKFGIKKYRFNKIKNTEYIFLIKVKYIESNLKDLKKTPH